MNRQKKSVGITSQSMKWLHDGGANDKDILRLLKENDLGEKMVQLFHMSSAARVQWLKSFILLSDFIPKSWTIVEDVVFSQLDVGKLKPVLFLRDGERRISGETMLQRAVSLRGNLGLADGKYLLAYQDEIPTELRNCIIVLPGTVLRDSDGSLRVPFLYFNDGCWDLGFDWLGCSWSDYFRFARSE